MRSRFYAAILASLAALAPSITFGQVIDQNKLSVTNYQLVSETHVDRTHDQLVYKLDLVNSGPALPSLTGTVTSYVSSIVVQGSPNLHFAPTSPANPEVTSLDTLTIVVDRTLNTSMVNLHWFFSANAPVANAGPNQTVKVGSTVTLDGSSSTNPSGSGTLTYSWAFTSTPPGSNATLSNPTSVSPTFVADLPTRTGSYNTNYVLTLTVSNGTASDTSSVTISTQPVPPTANAGPNQSVKVGNTVTLNGSGSTDPNGDSLTYAWTLTLLPSGSSAVLANANTVSPTFVADAAGQYIASLVVTDTDGLSSVPATVTITSTAPPPVANAGPNQSVNIGAIVQLNGSGSTDLSGNPITYKWSLITLPAGSNATLSDASLVNPTFTVDKAGTYVAQLIVNDGVSDSQPSTVTISTNVVLAPTAVAGPNQSLEVLSTVNLDGSASSDPQGLPLTFAWSLVTVPVNSQSALSSTNTAKTTFVPDQLGTYVAQLTVTNSAGLSNSATVTVTSNDVIPVAHPSGPATAAVGVAVTLDGSQSSDANNHSLTYSWTFTTLPSGSGATLSNANTASPTFVPDVAGAYVVQLIVNDGFLDSNPATFMIAAGLPPGITLSPTPLNIPLNGTGTLTVSIPTAPATGSGGQEIKLAVLDPTVVSVPASVMIPEGSTSATITITPLALGGTTLLASATGFTNQTVSINVVQSGITLSLSNNTVGITRTVTGTVTLSSPAPANGITVSLTSSVANGPVGSVTLPDSINIAAGATSQTFIITGASAGTATITASSPGYVSGTISLTVVTLGQIVLQNNASVAPGQTLPFTVSLVTPAPQGGVTINLVSSDATKVTVSPSVFIAQGATTPATPAQITGVNFGSASITASAGGFQGDAQTVQVQANLSLNPSLATVGLGSTFNLTLTVSGTAPAGGLSVSLSSNNSGIASVPQSVVIQQGQSSVNVPVTGVSQGGPVTITATPNVGGIASATATINVSSLLTITTATLPNGIVQGAYNTTVLATGGTLPYTFSASGLPAGLSISAGGVISGTPTGSPGASQVTISVKDSSTPTAQSMSANLSLTISAPLSIATTSLPNGFLGASYTAPAVAATGGNGPYSFTATGLPAGLSISTAGIISGTPTGSPGTSQVVITVTDSTNFVHATATATLSLTIGTALTVQTASLTNGEVNVPYSATITVVGGTSPYTLTATGLPAGLSISGSATGGTISGTPTAAGTTSVVIMATDSSSPKQTASSQSISLTIIAPPSITTTSLPGGVVGAPYSATVTATGGTGPLTFTATGLPGGLSISAAGVISGNPTAAGTITPVITVTDSASPKQSASVSNLSITIGAAPSITTPSPLPGGVIGIPYSATVNAAGGTPPYTFTAAGLPAGLSISTVNNAGVISGTPTAVGTTTAAVTVTDSTSPSHLSATANLSITITAPVGPTISGTNVTIGSNLETLVTFTLSAAPGQAQTVTVTSSDPTKVLLVDPRVPGNIGCVIQNGASVCVGTVTIPLDAAATSFSVIAQGLSSSGTVTLTATSQNYNPGMAQVALAPSGFVLSGPNGIGASFTTNEGVLNTNISVIAYQLNSAGQPGQVQQVRPLFQTDSNGNPILDGNGNPIPSGPLPVTLSSSNANVGTASPAQVTFAGGQDTATTAFNAGQSGSTVITANEPSGFSAPSNNANTLPVTVQPGGTIAHSATVGKGLETTTNFSLLGAPLSNQGFIVTSSDPSRLLLSTTPDGAGSPSIVLTVPGGFSNSAPFYVYGLANTGTVNYTVCEQDNNNPQQCLSNPDFPNATGMITLGPAGFILSTPSGLGGQGTFFNTTPASGDTQLAIFSALLDGSGNAVVVNGVVQALAIAGGTSVNVNVTSSTPSVGTITNSPVTIAGGNNTASPNFHPLANGSTTISVVAPSGFTTSNEGTTTANVSTPTLLLFGGLQVGNQLEEQGTISLSAPAPTGGLPVTLTVTSGSAKLSSSGTDAGAAQIVVTVSAGASSGTYFIYGQSASGSVSINATAPGFVSSSATDTLVPSGIVIGGPAGPGFTDTISAAAGPAPITVNSVILDPSTSIVLGTQPVAGNVSLSIPVSNSNPSAGTFPAMVTLTGGNDTATPNFAPGTTGRSTTLTITAQPQGFTVPSQLGFFGPPTSLTVQVTP